MAFEIFKPVDGTCYCVPIYVNCMITSIYVAMNYEIKVYRLKKSISGKEGEDQDETNEEK